MDAIPGVNEAVAWALVAEMGTRPKQFPDAHHLASRTKHTYLSALYRRIAARKNHTRAIVAVAHAILIVAYQILQNDQPYCELGENYFDHIRPEKTVDRLRRLQRLGYQVTIQRARSATC